MKRKSLLKILALLLLSLVISLLLQQFFQIGLSDVQNFVTSAGIWAPLVYGLVLLLGLTVPFNPISDSITVSIAALVFPPWVAIVMTFWAHSLALIINYYIAYHWGDDLLKKLVSLENDHKIDQMGHKIKPIWIFGVRFLLPLNALGFDIVSYAAGIAHMDFKKFFLASTIPWTILSVIYFSSAGFLRNINPSLIFLPALLLIVIPTTLVAVSKRQTLWDKVKSFLKR